MLQYTPSLPPLEDFVYSSLQSFHNRLYCMFFKTPVLGLTFLKNPVDNISPFPSLFFVIFEIYPLVCFIRYSSLCIHLSPVSLRCPAVTDLCHVNNINEWIQTFVIVPMGQGPFGNLYQQFAEQNPEWRFFLLWWWLLLFLAFTPLHNDALMWWKAYFSNVFFCSKRVQFGNKVSSTKYVFWNSDIQTF